MAMDALFPPLCLNCRRNVRDSSPLLPMSGPGEPTTSCIRCGRICDTAPLDLDIAALSWPVSKFLAQGGPGAKLLGTEGTMELARSWQAGRGSRLPKQAVTPAPAAGRMALF